MKAAGIQGCLLTLGTPGSRERTLVLLCLFPSFQSVCASGPWGGATHFRVFLLSSALPWPAPANTYPDMCLTNDLDVSWSNQIGNQYYLSQWPVNFQVFPIFWVRAYHSFIGYNLIISFHYFLFSCLNFPVSSPNSLLLSSVSWLFSSGPSRSFCFHEWNWAQHVHWPWRIHWNVVASVTASMHLEIQTIVHPLDILFWAGTLLWCCLFKHASFRQLGASLTLH